VVCEHLGLGTALKIENTSEENFAMLVANAFLVVGQVGLLDWTLASEQSEKFSVCIGYTLGGD